MPVESVSGSIYAFAVQEGSSAFIDIVVKNENTAIIIPKTVTWSLYDDTGTIVNSRTNVDATPAAVTKIVLDPEDTAIVGSTSQGRVFKVKAIYDSDRGTDLIATGGLRFRVLAI